MRDEFLQAMSLAASSVYIITTDGPGGRAGVTVSAVTSVSADPNVPTLMACIHNLAPAAAAIRMNHVFCVNLLAQDQSPISDSFAGRTGKSGVEKFDCADWLTGETGSPVLDNALAAFDCRLHHDLRVGSHHMFVGEVAGVTRRDDGAPLLYGRRNYLKTVGI